MADDIFSQLSDVETLTIKATALADLAMWIEQARTLIDRIRELTERDSAIAERFTANGIRYMSPEWDDDTSSGMTFLMLAQRAQIGEIAEILDELARTSAKPKHEQGSVRARNALRQSILSPEVVHA